ncbi:MAG TPA: electron transfer flavoprotein subunit beta/FixA family protein [Spirochaetia bacterium]|nr:electron transfer flavoprotein subunit beta/FixA family protein [Spirochaetia bacterium]
MKIVVPIKQVPATTNVKIDPDSGTVIREGSSAVVNPLDLYAIETALRLREVHGGRIEVLSMGPLHAERAIREAIAMGCDEGHLVSDRSFAGADTWSTSYVLSQAIRSLFPIDLIVTGERATDGDTGQVGPGIASWLDLPVATYVAKIVDIDPQDRSIVVERLVEEGYQIVRLRLPALISVVKEIAVPRLPTLRGKKRALQAEVHLMTREGMELERANLGLKGSPTKVVAIRKPRVSRGGRVVTAYDDVPSAVAELIKFLRERNAI